MKLKIRNWKDSLHDLKTLTSSKIRKVKRIKTKSVDPVYSLRNNLITAINEEFQKHIDNQKRVFSNVKLAKENGTNFAKCRDSQEALLNKMQELSFNQESYDKLKEFIKSIEKIAYKGGRKSKEKVYNEEICEYLVASQAQKREYEARILQDLRVKDRHLIHELPSKSELRSTLRKLIKSAIEDYPDSSS